MLQLLHELLTEKIKLIIGEKIPIWMLVLPFYLIYSKIPLRTKLITAITVFILISPTFIKYYKYIKNILKVIFFKIIKAKKIYIFQGVFKVWTLFGLSFFGNIVALRVENCWIINNSDFIMNKRNLNVLRTILSNHQIVNDNNIFDQIEKKGFTKLESLTKFLVIARLEGKL